MRPVVGADGSGVVRGNLRAGRAQLRGKYVVLLARSASGGNWQYRNGQRTDRQGLVSFRVRPQVRSAYRLAFAGTDRVRPVRSGTVEIGVRQVVSIAADAGRIDPGGSSVISGTVSIPPARWPA